ncbi:MAG: FAD-dependent oxidoreductase [Planctomycetota bacterium]
MSENLSTDVLIVGAGAVGSALAFELSRHGHACVLAERGRPGRESSWAAAGVLFPAHGHPEPAFRDLLRRGYELHRETADLLLEETGIDVGLRRCGVVAPFWESAAPSRAESWETVEPSPFEDAREISREEALEREPTLAPDIAGAFLCEEASQIHNPTYVEALVTAAARRGTTILDGAPLTEVQVESGRGVVAKVGAHRVAFDRMVICAGAWSAELGGLVSHPIDVEPVRGQVLLTETFPQQIRHIVMAGEAYLVPRPAGRILVGSTVEHVGFDKRNTIEGIEYLAREARRIAPFLASRPVIKTWSGLRPGSSDALPTMDRLGDLENVFVSTGHYRSGVILSTIAARLMGSLLEDTKPELSMNPYRYRRSKG